MRARPRSWAVLTERGVKLGQVAELHGEEHALAVGVRDGRDLALDVAAVGEGRLEESRLRQLRLVHDARGVIGHDGGVTKLLFVVGQQRRLT